MWHQVWLCSSSVVSLLHTAIPQCDHRFPPTLQLRSHPAEQLETLSKSIICQNLRVCSNLTENYRHNTADVPSIGTTDGSFIEGDIALLSTAAASARRPRALTGGVLDSLDRLARLDRPDDEGRVAVASRLRSAGKLVDAGFRRAGGALGSAAWFLEPRAMKSPGGG